MFDAQSALFEALSKSDLRPLQKTRIRMAVRLRPVVRAEVLGAVTMQLAAERLISESGEVMAAVDWQTIIDAIVKYLPTLLALIGLFI